MPTHILNWFAKCPQPLYTPRLVYDLDAFFTAPQSEKNLSLPECERVQQLFQFFLSMLYQIVLLYSTLLRIQEEFHRSVQF